MTNSIRNVIGSCLQLDDPLHGLAQGDGLPAAVVEVERVREIRGGLQQPVELALHHVVFVLGKDVSKNRNIFS